MRLAPLIVVLHVVKGGKSRVCEHVVALCSRIIHRLVGVDREDVGLAVLCDSVSCVLSASNFGYSASGTYLLLFLLERLIFLEEFRDIRLIGYFEHGDPLNGHFGGGHVRVTISDVLAREGSFEDGNRTWTGK